MAKKIEKLSDAMVYISAILMVIEFATKWNVVVRALILVDALILLGTVLYKLIAKK